MRDLIQATVQRTAYRTAMTRRVTCFCAKRVIYLLYGGTLLTVWQRRHMLTLAHVARASIRFGVSVALGKLLSRRVDAPRPFMTNGIPPLLPARPNDSFPSTHAIQAGALMAVVWEQRREHVPPMAAGALLVMLGRLGANVHRTADMIGGLSIVASVWLALRRLPLPANWDTLLTHATGHAATVLPAGSEGERALAPAASTEPSALS